MADKQKIEIDLDTKDAEKKISKLESGLRKMAGAISGYSPSQHFQAGGSMGTLGAIGGAGRAIGGKIGGMANMIPGLAGAAAQFGAMAAPVLAPNMTGLMKQATNPLGALDDTLSAFGSAKGSQKAVQGLFDAKLKMRNRQTEAEAFNRSQLGAARLEPISTVAAGIGPAVAKDIQHNIKTIADTLVKALGKGMFGG